MIVSGVLPVGVEIAAGAVPGLPLVFAALKAIYTLASSYRDCIEEPARLMSYCDTVATTLTRFKVRNSHKLGTALTAAAEALEELRAMIEVHMRQCNAALMFTSPHFKSTSEKVKHKVEAAVRIVMDEAQFLLMEDMADIREDLAKTKNDVALLLARRHVHVG